MALSGVSSETIGMEVVARLDSLRAQLGTIPDLTAKEARAMTAVLSGEFKKQTREMQKQTREMAQAQKQAALQAEAAWKSASTSLGSALKRGAQMAALAAAATGIAVAKVGADFDMALAKVQAMTGASEEDMVRLEKAARDMGKATLFSATEAAGALNELGKSGMSADQSIEALQATLLMAGASSVGIEEAASLTASTLKQFGLQATEATRVSDVMSKAIRTSLLDFEKLSAGMAQAGAAGSAFGMTLEETVAAVALFADLGLDGSTAGTNLKMALVQVAQGADNAKAALKRYSLTLDDVNPETHSFAQILQTMADVGLSAGDAMEIFGSRAGGNVAKIAQNIREGKTDIAAFTQALVDAGGETAAVYATILDTTESRAKIALSAAQEAAISAFEVISGPIDQLLTTLPGLFDEIARGFQIASVELGRLTDDALGDLARWIEKEGPQLAEAFVDAARMAAKFADILVDVLPYLDEVAEIALAAFAASKVVAWTSALNTAITTVRTLGMASAASLGPMGVAMAAIAVSAIAVTEAMGAWEQSIEQTERRAMATGQARIDMIDAEIAALRERERLMEGKAALQGGVTDSQAQSLADINDEMQRLQDERYAQVATMEAIAAATAETGEATDGATSSLDQYLAAMDRAEKEAKLLAETTKEEEAALKKQEAALEKIADIATKAASDTLTAEEAIIAARDEQLLRLLALAEAAGDVGIANAAAAAVSARAERDLAEQRAEDAEQRAADEQAAHDAEQKRIEDEQDSRLAQLDAIKSAFDSLFTGVADMSLYMAEKMADGNAEAAEKWLGFYKAASIAQILMDTGVAIMKAYAQLGPALGTVAAAGLGATAYVQIQQINATEIPAYPIGGTIHGIDHVPVMMQPGEGAVTRRGMDAIGSSGLADLNRGDLPSQPIIMPIMYQHRVYGQVTSDHQRLPRNPIRIFTRQLSGGVSGQRRR